ncbi:MAG TPA: hypothetical protein PK125_13735, partial [Syntrophorhabdus sp.]|nr:hypothetical protein [Syntrophorhabdus sp.]
MSLDAEDFIVDFAQKLNPFLSIIVIEILMGSMAERTKDELKNTDRTCSISHRKLGLAVVLPILCKKFFVV